MTETKLIYSTFGFFLIISSLIALIIHKQYIRKIIALNILGIGVFCLLITSAYNENSPPDPIPHALVLTGIVVSISATGLCLNMIKQLQKKKKNK